MLFAESMKTKQLKYFYNKFTLALIIILSASFSVAVHAKNSDARQKNKLDFTIIPMHYGLLNAEPHTWDEAKGLTKFEVVSSSATGERKITLTANQKLHESELFVYQSTAGNYFVNQVERGVGNTYYLKNSLPEDLAKGFNLWNFYDNGSHPNTAGYKAIADFALRNLNTTEIKRKKHVFIGDSWFNDGTLIDRLSTQVEFQSVHNKAVHGRTSAVTLSEFDNDFSNESTHNPDFVWVSLGTNDYWQEPTPVSKEKFIHNIEKIINKINALGAKAIVIDSSVGILDYNAVEPAFSFRKKLSDGYSDALRNLYQNRSLSSKSDSGAGLFIFDLLSMLVLLLLSAFARKTII